MEGDVHKQIMTDDLMLSIFVAIEGAHAFSTFMPSPYTIKKTCATQSDANDLRTGFVMGVVFNLSLGAVVSYFAGSKKPLLAAALVSGSMAGIYEWRIRNALATGDKEESFLNVGTAPQDLSGGIPGNEHSEHQVLSNGLTEFDWSGGTENSPNITA